MELNNYILGLGIGDWGLGIGPNPQSPIPNPQSPIPMSPKYKFFNSIKLIFIYMIIILKIYYLLTHK